MSSSAFYAYPSGNRLIQDAVSTAVDLSINENLSLKPWEAMRIVGFKIDDLIREQINDIDVLIADITFSNHNVLYEIGYAIAVGKPVILTVNTAIEKSVERIQRLGLFDTFGWVGYNNGNELSEKLRQWNDISWASRYSRRRDYGQPLFVLDTLMKTDFRNHIFQAVDNSHLQKRIFDPAEVPRLTAEKALAEVSASAGVIIPIINEELVDAERHNFRAAFVIGLAHGLNVDPLVIQYENAPVPLDYRDFIKNSTYRRETEDHVTLYCSATLIKNQQVPPRNLKQTPGILSKIELGSSAAENEMQILGSYFVETAEYSRALRAEGAVIIGRKGMGKTAIFLEAARDARRDRRCCVVDLRPASHNLSEMRSALLSVESAGIFDHTIAAFWQYIIYVEILLKIRELVLPSARNDSSLQDRVRKIEEDFNLTDEIVSGDFTSRLDSAVNEVIATIKNIDSHNDLRARLTNIMFEQPIPRLREAIDSFRDYFSTIMILIDDLDKGWPARRVEEHDIVTVKHLIEVLNRIQRDISRRGIEFRHLLFLRSDIYERLVEQTSDRGKYNPIKVDWSDQEQLRHLLLQRVMSALEDDKKDSSWAAFNTQLNGYDVVGSMIDTSLRRPRFLIDLAERTLSFAINRGHTSVSKEDVEEGMNQMSLYLVSDFAYELRDIAGTPENIFYRFIGKPSVLSFLQLQEILADFTSEIQVNEMVDLLLWYGFLGINQENRQSIFIYDRAYDFRRIEAEREQVQGELKYAVNPAFLRGLRQT